MGRETRRCMERRRRKRIKEAARKSRVVRGRLKAAGSNSKCRGTRERTPNMRCMLLTLDVSQLSGWLKADAR